MRWLLLCGEPPCSSSNITLPRGAADEPAIAWQTSANYAVIRKPTKMEHFPMSKPKVTSLDAIIEKLEQHGKDRQSIIKNMSKELRPICAKLEMLDRKNHTSLLRHRHEVGTILKEMVKDDYQYRAKHKKPKYGKEPIKVLSIALDREYAELDTALWLAREYPGQEEIDRLCNMTLPNGCYVTWTNLRTLRTVDDKAEREAWLVKAAENHWTSEELYFELEDERPPDHKKGGGRHLAAPE